MCCFSSLGWPMFPPFFKICDETKTLETLNAHRTWSELRSFSAPNFQVSATLAGIHFRSLSFHPFQYLIKAFNEHSCHDFNTGKLKFRTVHKSLRVLPLKSPSASNEAHLHSVLTGTAAMSVGFSTVQSPLLPFLILLDYSKEKVNRIRKTNIRKKCCNSNINDDSDRNLHVEFDLPLLWELPVRTIITYKSLKHKCFSVLARRLFLLAPFSLL